MLQLHIYGRLLAAHAPVGAPPAGRPSPAATIKDYYYYYYNYYYD